MAHHHDPVTPLRIFLLEEGSAQRWFHSEQIQIVGSHQRAVESFRLAIAREIDRHGLGNRGGKPGKTLALLSIVEKIRRSNALFFSVAHPSPEPHQALWIDERQGPQ